MGDRREVRVNFVPAYVSISNGGASFCEFEPLGVRKFNRRERERGGPDFLSFFDGFNEVPRAR